MIVFNNKIKFISFRLIFISIFMFIFIFSIGCVDKQKSSLKAIDTKPSNNYFISYRGYDTNIFLDSPSTVILKYFFKDKYGPFQMNYNLIPPIDFVYNQDVRDFKDRIAEISSKLEKDSTLVLYINAHGAKNGICSTYPDLNDSTILHPLDLLVAFRKGRTNPDGSLKPPFKRLILWVNSCYSGNFAGNIFPNIPEIKDKSFFEEGIYISSSDAALLTFSTSIGNFIAFSLLRSFQIQRCNSTQSKEKDYELALNTVKEYIKEYRGLRLFYSVSFFEKCFGSYNDPQNDNKPTFSNDTPTFKDYENIIERYKKCIKSEEPTYSMYIKYSDPLLENAELFPKVCN